jgi:hypothetical protein
MYRQYQNNYTEHQIHLYDDLIFNQIQETTI